MKDIVITGAKVRRELLILLACFAVAECINAGAIIWYSRPAAELVTMLGYVIVVTVIIYLLVLILRLLAALVVFLVRKLKG